MLNNEILILAGTAAAMGFIHTVLGPDHYLPFVALSKARNWPIFKTSIVTLLCGLGHILSSVVLGFIGIAFGVAVSKLEAVEAARGEWAAWFLIIFGFTYFVWGLRRAIRTKPHNHPHPHEDGLAHSHTHRHTFAHAHIHADKSNSVITPWVIFIIFVFGPCEPLIPLLMYPAAKHNIAAVALVALVFGFITILTMLGIVIPLSYGLLKLPFNRLQRYSHALAGLAIFLCGSGIKFLGF